MADSAAAGRPDGDRPTAQATARCRRPPASGCGCRSLAPLIPELAAAATAHHAILLRLATR
eukprot:10136007-Alexandrium_andersonii.AAC.1